MSIYPSTNPVPCSLSESPLADSQLLDSKSCSFVRGSTSIAFRHSGYKLPFRKMEPLFAHRSRYRDAQAFFLSNEWIRSLCSTLSSSAAFMPFKVITQLLQLQCFSSYSGTVHISNLSTCRIALTQQQPFPWPSSSLSKNGSEMQHLNVFF